MKVGWVRRDPLAEEEGLPDLCPLEIGAHGYSKSQHRFVWGARLVLLTDTRGLPLGYTIVPVNEKE